MKRLFKLVVFAILIVLTSCTTESDNVWLKSETIFDGEASNEFDDFIKEFNLLSSDFTINNYEDYKKVYSKLPLFDVEILDEEIWNGKNEITIVKLRYISGSVDFVDVEYYYNKLENTIFFKYVNNFDESYPDVEIGIAIDIIIIPREIYLSVENRQIVC